MQALCGLLTITTPVAALYAQPSAPDPSPPPRPSGPADPWTSPDGAAPPPAYGTDALGAPAAGYPGGGMIQVDVKADAGGVRLDRVQGGGYNTTVCVAPCSRLVPRNNLYVIDGDGIRSTSQFLLPDDRDQVTLNVEAGSSGRHTGGAVLMVGGLVVGYVGLFVAEAGLASNAIESANGSSHHSTDLAAAGGIMLAAGVAAAIGGLYMVLTSSTKVTSSTGSTFSEEKRPRPRSAVALTPSGLTF